MTNDDHPTHPYHQVREFHQTFSHPVSDSPQIPEPHRVNLRLSLIEEEYSELLEALADNDLTEVADALGDMTYVIFGMALEFGIPLHDVIDEIHSSNMSKLDENGQPIYRQDGKILKGKNFRPPNIDRILHDSVQYSATD